MMYYYALTLGVYGAESPDFLSHVRFSAFGVQFP